MHCFCLVYAVFLQYDSLRYLKLPVQLYRRIQVYEFGEEIRPLYTVSATLITAYVINRYQIIIAVPSDG
jgi:hypothetical protein